MPLASLRISTAVLIALLALLDAQANPQEPHPPQGQAHADKGAHFQPGETFTYNWSVPERAGPGPADPSSILWMYHSHFDEAKEINTGLIGPIIVSRRGSTKPDGTPQDVDREFITAFAIFDETQSEFFDRKRF